MNMTKLVYIYLSMWFHSTALNLEVGLYFIRSFKIPTRVNTHPEFTLFDLNVGKKPST